MAKSKEIRVTIHLECIKCAENFEKDVGAFLDIQLGKIAEIHQ